MDYNTSRGIDVIARNKGMNKITEGAHWYIELNHTFDYIRWIVYWDFDRSIQAGTEIVGVDPPDVRTLVVPREGTRPTHYFLDTKKEGH